jgi:hypothetical protein
VDATGNRNLYFSTGDIPKTNYGKNTQNSYYFRSKSNTTLTFIVRSNKSDTNGNDVAMNDIKVYQLLKNLYNEGGLPF